MRSKISPASKSRLQMICAQKIGFFEAYIIKGRLFCAFCRKMKLPLAIAVILFYNTIKTGLIMRRSRTLTAKPPHIRNIAEIRPMFFG